MTPMPDLTPASCELCQEAERFVGARRLGVDPYQHAADADALLEALLAHARHWQAEAQRHQWQDISTAPKDGTLVLLSKAGDAEWALRCRRYENGHWRGYDADDATHWMPLPAAPESGR